MARPQPPRSQFMTMMLVFVCIFLGMQFLFPKNQNTDTRPYTDVLKQLREFNRDEKDVEAAALLPLYQKKVGEARDQQKWTQDEFERHELEGIVLVAHTKFKGALSRLKYPEKSSLVHKKLNDGWTLMQGSYQKLHANPIWTTPVDVTPDPQFKSAKIEPSALYDKLVADLSERNHTELVWGLFQGYPAIDALVRLTGSQPGFSYWFAAFLLALLVRLVIFPWSMKQYRFGRQMMQIQPYVKEIQEKFKDKKTKQIPPDKAAQAQAETLAIYKEYGLNPLAGCSSALLQMPIFMIVLGAMQLYRFEFVKGTFLWIHPGATKLFGLNLAPNLGQPDQLLIIFYGISMIVSQLLMPVSDPTQIKQQRLMGLGVAVFITFGMFTYVLPSAFTLYWAFANVLATAQAVWAYKMPAPPLEKVQNVKGGVKPKPGFMERLQNMMEEQAKNQQQQQDKGEDNGKPSNGLPEARIDPKYFGKTGPSKKGRKK